MEGRLSSLTRCIRNAVATWREFCPEIRGKQKQSPFAAILSQPNLNEDQKKKQGLHPSLCDFYPHSWNEDQSKKVLLDDFIVCGFIVRYLFYCVIYVFFVRYLTATFESRPNKLEKRYFPLTVHGGTLNFPLGEDKSQWGDANYRLGDASLLQFKYGLYFLSQVMALFHYYIPLRCVNNISC